MQISRHWRMNSQRYRLEGYRYTNGEVSLQTRPAALETNEVKAQQPDQSQQNETAAA